MKRIALALGLLLVGRGLRAQGVPPSSMMLGDSGAEVATVPTPVYDVSSVKENKSGPGMFRVGTHGNTYEGTNLGLTFMLADAYGVRQDVISGLPKWAEDTRYDVLAKVSDADAATMKKLTQVQRQEMLARVLEERFGLKVHRETRTLAIFDLVPAKDGVKLKEVSPMTAEEKAAQESAEANPPAPGAKGPTPRGGMRFGPGMFEGTDMSLGQVVGFLESQTGKRVVDQTGLRGRYDVKLKYTPEGRPETDDLPSLYAALEEQLGLKLKADKGPVETLVVNAVKMPTEN